MFLIITLSYSVYVFIYILYTYFTYYNGRWNLISSLGQPKQMVDSNGFSPKQSHDNGKNYLHNVSVSSYLTLTALVCFYINDLLILNILTSYTKH